MKQVHYLFSIDEDVRKKYSTHDVARDLWIYLNDPDGWGISFSPRKTSPDVEIRLSSGKTIAKICGLPKDLSCAELGGKHMYLNAERWFHGSHKSGLSLEDYRQYMVTHEMGHILGKEHESCPCKGCRAPVMMQQTLGIGECRPNTKVSQKI